MSFLIPSLSDMIDILIIAFLIFQSILIMRRTGSYQILYGFLIILFLSFLAGVMKLHMISSVLDSLRSLWILIMVIIFQPEIRELLTKLKLSPGLFKGKSDNNRDFYGALIDAVSAMSFRRIGALIVMERKRRLDDYISIGEMIDSAMSLRLILSIFNIKSVLHDGAIIIRNGRIASAKVVLPLSKNPEYIKKYGTRHLAALGISEVSDALAIVVSEQTGRVSIASGGTIQTDIAFEEMMQIITDATV